MNSIMNGHKNYTSARIIIVFFGVIVLSACVRSVRDYPSTLPVPGISPDAHLFSTPTAQVPVSPEFLPLNTGTTWIYRYEAYSGDEKAVWRVTESIVESRSEGDFWVARAERQKELEEGDPTATFHTAPETGVYWYLSDGMNVYIQEDNLDINRATDSWLELIYPLPADCWFPEPHERGKMVNSVAVPGCRQAESLPRVVVTPVGTFNRCIDIITPYNNGSIYQTFCPGIGMVESWFDHLGTPYGFRSELTGYLLSGRP